MEDRLILVIAIICLCLGIFFVEFLDIVLGKYLVGIAVGLFLSNIIRGDDSNRMD